MENPQQPTVVPRVVTTITLAIVAGLLAWPILAPKWLPFVDHPQHLGTIAALCGRDTPAFAPWFDASLAPEQYMLFYWIAVAASWFGDVETGGRVAVIAAIALQPIAVALWLRENGRPPLLAALAGGAALHAWVMWGFHSFHTGVTASLFALAALSRLWRRPDLVTAAVLAIASLVAFYGHALTFAWFGLAAVLHAIELGRRMPGAVARRALALSALAALPSLAATAAWIGEPTFLDRRSIDRGGANEFSFLPGLDTLRHWMSHSFDAWADGSGRWTAIAFLAVATGLVLLRVVGPAPQRIGESAALPPLSARAPLAAPLPSFAPELTLAATFLAYLFAPLTYGIVAPINWRYLPVALLLVPALGPRTSLRRATQIVVAASCIGVTALAAANWRAGFAFTDAEMGELDEALAHTEPGHKLVGLCYAPISGTTGLPTFMHAHQYYQARIGGLAYFTFAEFPMAPVRLRPGALSHRPPPGFEWNPGLYDHSKFGDDFDYWLVRGKPPDGLFAAAPPSGAAAPDVLFAGPTWTLFGRRAPR